MSKNTDIDDDTGVWLVLVSCPPDQSERLARALLETEKVACINIIPGLKSFYRWQGKLQQDNESLLLIKCPKSYYSLVEEMVLDLHPYELPEIITVSVAGGLTDYLNWVLHPDNKQSE